VVGWKALPSRSCRASKLNDRERERAVRLRSDGYTQTEVASVLGVAQSTVSKWETGNKYGTGRAAGRPNLLSDEEHALLRQHNEEDPFGGVIALKDFLWEEGLELSEGTGARGLRLLLRSSKSIWGSCVLRELNSTRLSWHSVAEDGGGQYEASG